MRSSPAVVDRKDGRARAGLASLVAVLVAALVAVLVAGAPRRVAWAADAPPPSAPAHPATEVPADLRPAVDAAVAKGAAWLARQAGPDGVFAWSVPTQRTWSHWPAAACDEGLTALAVLALVRAGRSRADPVVARSLETLRRRLTSALPPAGGRDARTFTYGAGALLWMLSEVAPSGFSASAAQAALGIAHGVGPDGRWGYVLPRVRVDGAYASVLPDPVPTGTGDLSNAQFAVLGLVGAERLGVWSGRAPWRAVREGLPRSALPDGAFAYRADDGAGEPFRMGLRTGRRLTTSIAAANLVVALRREGASAEAARRDPAVRRALAWLGRNPFLDPTTGRWARRDVGDRSDRPPYLEMLAMDRLAHFGGLPRVGGAEVYRTAAVTLLGLQREDGRWPGDTGDAAFRNAVEHTTLALLVLTRAVASLPVVTPTTTTATLLGAADALEPHYSDVVAASVRAHAETLGEARLAWQRAFVTAGVRALRAAARLQAEGPSELAPAAHGLLRLLTGVPVEVVDREARARAWARWLFEHGERLGPSDDGLAFVVR